MAALAVLDAEQNASHSQIRDFGQALWWAFATITTVGYGDVVPVTFVGRLVGVGLMLGGIGIIATVAATLSSWLVQNVDGRERDDAGASAKRIDALTREVAELKQLIAEGATSSTPRGRADRPRVRRSVRSAMVRPSRKLRR
ncbi:potassium channel family protein [Gryllotalpicola reticulitermitis]|uniref:Potassium channel family protein n=1 Tax=Gryllotalpicola reticulitermitis TaxID=1184153 RepID=A0ABV8QD04_9MICO